MQASSAERRPAGRRVVAMADGVDRVIGVVCQAIILLTTIVLLAVLGANVVARYALGGGGLHWSARCPSSCSRG